MKAWINFVCLMLAATAAAQLNTDVAQEDRKMAERVFRQFTKAAAADTLQVRRLNGRDIEVKSSHETCTVDSFQEAVSSWRLDRADGNLSETPVDEARAIALARAFAEAQRIKLSSSPKAVPQSGTWTIRFEKHYNGYETPLADVVEVDRSGRVVRLEREGLGFRFRPTKIVVAPKDAVNIARDRFVERFGEAQTAGWVKTSYQFVDSSEIEGRTVSPMAPRRLRLSHSIKVSGAGRVGTVVLDVIDGEIVRDEFAAASEVKTGLGPAITLPSQGTASLDPFMIFAALAAIGAVSGTMYWYRRLRRAQIPDEADEL